jgi:hypothetical protein
MNLLHGTIPAAWSELKNMDWLGLGGNKLHGTLPRSWSALTALKVFRISLNNFTGTVPKEYGNLRLLNSFEISGNPILKGCLPKEWKEKELMTPRDPLMIEPNGRAVTPLSGTNITGYCAG